MLEAQALCCIRDERILFDKLSFTVQPGELVQIEGANGTGKTSLLRILAGLADAESGEVRWNDKSIRRHRDDYHQQLLYLGHHPGVKAVLTAFENLAFYQSIINQRDSDAVWLALEKVGLAGYEDVPVAQLSAGQQRRVALARLWLSQAPLWILDEPLTAIDKLGVSHLIALFEQHTAQNGIVLLTTHQDMVNARMKVRKICLQREGNPEC